MTKQLSFGSYDTSQLTWLMEAVNKELDSRGSHHLQSLQSTLVDSIVWAGSQFKPNVDCLQAGLFVVSKFECLSEAS